MLTQLYQRGYLPPGSHASPQLRARAAALVVAPAIRQRVVAGRMTAAWIYGCATEPDRLALLVDANRRISSLRSVRGCTFHEVRLGPFDVVSMGGLMVSSPLRTAVDVAMHVDAERAVPASGRCWLVPSWASACGCSGSPWRRVRAFRISGRPWRSSPPSRQSRQRQIDPVH
ncbi:type IV toxin-antitoxin system AbiEi family antitoxin [Arthrobacter sp. NicSoilC12]|uniref:type IV toxin-antitoxin system AbiEi family antitoxin n=1 Tax=Arthrobacter sp. NicSoilC12 TaxID=2831001 RepID=UPI001CC47F38|nr:type IV toxin-antitoxin system AbiEi family antitoxin [Arthrobacter sp. NicSoilC12]